MMSRWKTIYVIRFYLPLKEMQKKKCHAHWLGSTSHYLIGSVAFILSTHAIQNWIISNTFHRHLKHTMQSYLDTARQFVSNWRRTCTQKTHENSHQNREREPYFYCVSLKNVSHKKSIYRNALDQPIILIIYLHLIESLVNRTQVHYQVSQRVYEP